MMVMMELRSAEKEIRAACIKGKSMAGDAGGNSIKDFCVDISMLYASRHIEEYMK